KETLRVIKRSHRLWQDHGYLVWRSSSVLYSKESQKRERNRQASLPLDYSFKGFVQCNPSCHQYSERRPGVGLSNRVKNWGHLHQTTPGAKENATSGLSHHTRKHPDPDGGKGLY